MKRKVALYAILALMLMAGGGIGWYYWYEGTHYVKSEDARIAGDIYRIMPKIAGKLLTLDVAEGDAVTADQIVGRQETTNLPANLLDNAILRAPISGTVIKTLAKPGEVVSPGQAVAMVVDDSRLYVSANIEETSIARLKPGQRVEIAVDAFPDQPLTGRVTEIGKATNSTFSLLPSTNTSGNFTKVTQRLPVKISIDDTKGLPLAPGMNVVIKIVVKEK